MTALRDFMFAEVYMGAAARREHAKIERVVSTLFHHFADHPEALPPVRGEAGLHQRVTDHVAGMTDRYAVRAFAALSVPAPFEV
jgi:dGTPase